MNQNAWSRRSFLKTAGLGLAALTLTGSAGRYAVQAQSKPALAVGMRVRGGVFEFDPVAVRLQPGDTLTWFQIVDFHSATAYHPQNNRKALRIPQGATPWDSGLLGLDGRPFTFSHTFEEIEGIYDYFCIPHEFLGMVGRIVVGEAKPGPATEQPLPDFARGVIPAVEEITGLAGATFNGAGELNLPLLRIFEKDQNQALVELDGLLERFAAGQGVAGSLWEALKAAGQLDPYRSGLGGFGELVRQAPAFRDALQKADELKAILSQAREALR